MPWQAYLQIIIAQTKMRMYFIREDFLIINDIAEIIISSRFILFKIIMFVGVRYNIAKKFYIFLNKNILANIYKTLVGFYQEPFLGFVCVTFSMSTSQIT